MSVKIDSSICTGCKLCLESCPEDVFKLGRDSKVPRVFRPDECFHCGACVMDCPEQCIHMVLPLPLRPRFIEKGLFAKITGRPLTPK
jgi:NAD-dependent dihydropyrimidine dehydrogenase PreA subunit